MKTLAKGIKYWPEMDEDTKQLVKGCFKYHNAARSPPREKPMPQSSMTIPWSGVHVDSADAISDHCLLSMVTGSNINAIDEYCSGYQLLWPHLHDALFPRNSSVW